ncbi:HNH endonuclease [Roseovarius sp. MMSF_3350]|uniref:HNH endonuclease n=1 Tax=Roseovarius sp. MMSF_3350 TaxID=3046706 RepID=UPI00273E32D9|nr:HNH endonuclease [Roseovarius sp. MMSF_3350]
MGETYCAAHAGHDKGHRDQLSDARRRDKPSRRWYNLKAWRGPGGRRLRQLEAEPLCELCPASSRRVATVADHVEPHREDHGRFWFGKLQSLCAHCHNSKKQREEKRSRGGSKVQPGPVADRRG